MRTSEDGPDRHRPAKVFLHTVAADLPPGAGTGIDDRAYTKLLECARADRVGVHILTDDPEAADLIIFAELGFSAGLGHFDRRLRHHPLIRRHRPKCFVYNSADNAIPFLPGIYPSIERRWCDPQRVRSGHYLSSHMAVHPLITRPYADRDLLFSFLGSASNHPVRKRLLEVQHSRGWCRDMTVEARRAWATGGAVLERFLADYAEIMSRSRFSICPRGLGTSSVRLFESMRFGVVPVVISDQWVQPTGPLWESCSVRIPERDVSELPEILAALEPRAEEMGRLARQAWEEWFADDVSFHRVVGWCNEIRESRAGGPDPLLNRLAAHGQMFRPLHLRNAAGHTYHRVRKALGV